MPKHKRLFRSPPDEGQKPPDSPANGTSKTSFRAAERPGELSPAACRDLGSGSGRVLFLALGSQVG